MLSFISFFIITGAYFYCGYNFNSTGAQNSSIYSENSLYPAVNLSDLIVLNGIFTHFSARDLASLIAVSSLNGESFDNLANLLVLSNLFGNLSANDLAALIATDNVLN